MSGLTKNKLTKKDIEEIIELRRYGLTFAFIGEIFDIHHRTVMYHTQKYEQTGNIKIQKPWRKIVKRTIPTTPKVGKTYKDYLTDSRGKRRDILAEALSKIGFKV